MLTTDLASKIINQGLANATKEFDPDKSKAEDDSSSQFYLLMRSKIDNLLELIRKDVKTEGYSRGVLEVQRALLTHKQDYSTKVVTRRLVNGEGLLIDPLKDQFVNIEHEEVMKSAGHSKSRQLHKDLLVSGLKTKEVLRSRINAKTSNPAECLLLCLMSLGVAAIVISIAAASYYLSKAYYSEEFEELERLHNSYILLANVYGSAYYARENYLLATTVPPYIVHLGFSTREEYEAFVNEAMEDYEERLQDGIENNALMSVDYYSSSNLTILYFDFNWNYLGVSTSFMNALLEHTSFLYKLRSTAEYKYKTFIMRHIQENVYSAVAPKLKEMNEMFYGSLRDGNIGVLLGLAIAVCVLIVLFLPVSAVLIYRINLYSYKVMELFLDLPCDPLSDLITDCEIFSSLIHKGNASDTERNFALKRSNLDEIDHFRTHARRYRNYASFFQCSLLLSVLLALAVAAYFVVNFALEYLHREDIKDTLYSLNRLMKIESELHLSFSCEMEKLHIGNGISFAESRGCSEGVVTQNDYEIIDELEIIEVYGDSSTSEILTAIFQGNLCHNELGITPHIPYSACEDFVEKSAMHGLKVLILYYLQLLRQINLSQEFPSTLIQQREIIDLYFLVKEFLAPFMRKTVEIMIDSEKSKYDKLILMQMYFMILLIVILAAVFLLGGGLFMPFMVGNVKLCLSLDQTREADADADSHGNIAEDAEHHVVYWEGA